MADSRVLFVLNALGPEIKSGARRLRLDADLLVLLHADDFLGQDMRSSNVIIHRCLPSKLRNYNRCQELWRHW